MLSPRIPAVGAVDGSTALSVLDEISKATLTPFWFDESGVMTMIPSDRLITAAPMQTITTLDDITDLAWSDTLLSVRSKVECGWSAPAISSTRQYILTLYSGGGDTLEPGDKTVDFVTVPSGETWVAVDQIISTDIYGANSTFNRGRGSFGGAVIMDPEQVASPTDLVVTMERINDETWKFTHTASSSLASDKSLVLRTSGTSTSLWPIRRTMNLPIIRGMGRAVWSDAVAVAAATGPVSAPALRHELGPWGAAFVAGGSVAQRIADFIAPMVTTPHPTIPDVSVIYDPRRQLGDVYTLNSGLLGISLNVLVVGITVTFNGGFPEQKLSLRIISGGSTAPVTYDELAAAWQGGNYNGLQAVWAGMNYTAFTNDPLEGAPNP